MFGVEAAKSPVVAAITVGAVSGHGMFLVALGHRVAEKTKPPVGWPTGGSKTALVATLLARAPVGYQARLWLNQYPK